MKQTIVVKLMPTPEQHQALLATVEAYNAGCNFVAAEAFRLKTANKMRLQKTVYFPLREKFKLSAQMAVRVIAKTCEAFKRDRSKQPTFKPHGAIVYDERLMSFKGLDTVSLLTLDGRIKVPIVFGKYQEARMSYRRGQADLIYRQGTFYLALTIDLPEPPISSPDGGIMGVDLGIVNLATTSDGETFSGATVEACRQRYAKLRRRLQRRGSKSSRRHLCRVSGKEMRFKRDVNHVISKGLVARAKDTSRSIALEDLKGIRARCTVRRLQRDRHARWAFNQLRQFIDYKARMASIPVILVDPRNTSRTCPQCGFVSKSNRRSQALFSCRSCGYAALADLVGAINIARVAVIQPIVSDEQLIVQRQGQAAAL